MGARATLPRVRGIGLKVSIYYYQPIYPKPLQAILVAVTTLIRSDLREFPKSRGNSRWSNF